MKKKLFRKRRKYKKPLMEVIPTKQEIKLIQQLSKKVIIETQYSG